MIDSIPKKILYTGLYKKGGGIQNSSPDSSRTFEKGDLYLFCRSDGPQLHHLYRNKILNTTNSASGESELMFHTCDAVPCNT